MLLRRHSHRRSRGPEVPPGGQSMKPDDSAVFIFGDQVSIGDDFRRPGVLWREFLDTRGAFARQKPARNRDTIVIGGQHWTCFGTHSQEFANRFWLLQSEAP